jgi:hypothetical protein
MLPADLLRQGLANPALLRAGASLALPADIPARPVPGPATMVSVQAQSQPAGPSVGPAPQFAGAFPHGTLGAAIARLAGIAFPQGEPAGAAIPARGEAAPALRPGLIARPVLPEIAEAVQRGAARQIPLGAAIEALLAAPEGEAGLPAPLAAALRALAAGRALPHALGHAEGLERAIRASGLFLEGALARGEAPADLKSQLLRLRAEAARNPEHARAAEMLRAADGAVERVKLMQLASLPEHPEIRLTDERGAPLRLALQIPLATQGHERPQTAMLGLVIEHNPFAAEPPAYAVENEGNAEAEEGFPWKIRVALDLEETGPVQAEIALRGQAVAVTLWAERPATAGTARAEIGALHAALTDAAFEVTRLDVRDGMPLSRPARHAPMLDRRT